MNWTAMAMLVIGGIIIIATSVISALENMWRRQERRDGIRHH